MIEHINDRCNRWSKWCLTGKNNGLGYPTQSIYTRLEGRSPQRLDPNINEEAIDTEAAIQSLPAALKTVVTEVYLRTGTTEQLAKRLGCHRDTLYARLHAAHVKIMDHLALSAPGEV